MGKSKGSKAAQKTEQRTRTTGVALFLAQISALRERAVKLFETAEKWHEADEEHEAMGVACDKLKHIVEVTAEIPEDAELSTFVPPVRVRGAVAEGDTVAIHADHKDTYFDLLGDAQNGLKVVKATPGKGGGAIVENGDGMRARVPFSHLVRG